MAPQGGVLFFPSILPPSTLLEKIVENGWLGEEGE